jgi:hypothetical protein
MAFLFKLETLDGEPAEPHSAVPNWRAGDDPASEMHPDSAPGDAAMALDGGAVIKDNVHPARGLGVTKAGRRGTPSGPPPGVPLHHPRDGSYLRPEALASPKDGTSPKALTIPQVSAAPHVCLGESGTSSPGLTAAPEGRAGGRVRLFFSLIRKGARAAARGSEQRIVLVAPGEKGGGRSRLGRRSL